MKRATQVRDLMSRPVRRLSMNSRIRDAADFLRRWGISGAPVFDLHGRPVGVFSLRDVAGHLANRFEELPVIDVKTERVRKSGEPIPEDDGFHFERIDDARVSDVMTPAILCIDPDAPILDAIRMMRERSYHRIFVRKGQGPLLGVVTTMDVLRWVSDKSRPRRKARGTKRVG